MGLRDGVIDLVDAGHPPPYLLRDGVATTVDLVPGLPLGVGSDPYAEQRLRLEPGDRLVMVTDGFLERNAVHVPLRDLLEASVDRHPREVVRELAGQVLAATGGQLRDDATVLCIDWYGPGAVRQAAGGASRDRATSA